MFNWNIVERVPKVVISYGLYVFTVRLWERSQKIADKIC
jgi:hypothetical protein